MEATEHLSDAEIIAIADAEIQAADRTLSDQELLDRVNKRLQEDE